MNQEIAVIGEDPLRLVVALHADRQFTGLMFQLKVHFVADGLHLPGIGGSADDKVIGEGGDSGEIQDDNVGGLFGFGRAYGNQPIRGRCFSFVGFGKVDLRQTKTPVRIVLQGRERGM
jgi:hypothetical protein